MAVLVYRVRSRGCGTAPNGGAAGGVGNVHTVAVQLGGQLGIRSLAAACASAGELQIRLSVLHADGIVGKQLRFFGGVHQRIIDLLPIQLAGNGFHGQGLGGTHIGAGGAAGAVQYGHNQSVLIIRSLVLHHGGTLRRGSRFLCIHSNGTNHCMRADHGTQVTLGALGAVPLGYGNGNAPLLKGGRTGRIYAVRPISKGRYRQIVAVQAANRIQNFLDKLFHLRTIGGYFQPAGCVFCSLPAVRHIHLHDLLGATVNAGKVGIHHRLAFLGELLDHGGLHQLNGLLYRQNTGDGKECRLQDGGSTTGQAHFLCDLNAVNDIEMDVVFCNIALHGRRQLAVQLIRGPNTVEQESTTGHQILYHIILGHIGRTVAGHKVGLVDQIGRGNG